MPELYSKVKEIVHIPPSHPMYEKYVNDSIWKYMYGDQKVEKLSRYIDIVGLKVLDVGAGIGGIAAAFAKKGASVTAIDVDDGYQQLSIVGYEESGVQVESLIFDGAEFPFPNESFDVVCCFNIFEHVPDLKRLFREMERVLKPGGIVIGRADYKYNKANIKADPHYGVPWIILTPRWFRKWIVVDVLKRNHELDDIVWAKNFKDIAKRFKVVNMHTYEWEDDFISVKPPMRDKLEVGLGTIDITTQRECFPVGWYTPEQWENETVMWSGRKALINIFPLIPIEEISFEMFVVEDKNVSVNGITYHIQAGQWKLIKTRSNGSVKITTTGTVVPNDSRTLGMAIKNVKVESAQ